jgi:hypothetical protein
MSDRKSVLYVALDESNHGLFPEVCVAIFSTIPEDAQKQEFFCKGDKRLLCQLPSENRDYTFLFLQRHQVKPSKSNLALAAPSLILPYLQAQEGRFDLVNIYLDGRLDMQERKSLEQEFGKHTTKVHAKGFIKRWRTSCECAKSYVQHHILGIADAKAHSLYEEYQVASKVFNVQEVQHDKLVQLLA